MVPITHEQNIICSKTRLDGPTHEQIIICRQLFAGHMVGSWPMERKKKNASNDNSIYYVYKHRDLLSANSLNKNRLSLMRSILIGHTIIIVSDDQPEA